MTIIDAHIHSWDPAISTDILVYERFPVLNRRLEAQEAEIDLRPLGIDGAVLVQSEPSDQHSRYCVSQMRGNSFVRAVTGWADPFPENGKEDLSEFAAECAGNRIMLNRTPQTPEAEPSLVEVCVRFGAHDVTVELLAHQNHLDLVGRLSRAAPDTRFVLNHSAQPDTSQAPVEGWKSHMQTLGRQANIYNKVSGLLEKSGGTTTHIAEHLAVLFDSFSADRLMFATNWPMINLFGGTQLWLDTLNDCLPVAYDAYATSRLWSETALSVYKEVMPKPG